MRPASDADPSPPTALSEDLLERLIEADERAPGPEEHDLTAVGDEFISREMFQRLTRLIGLPINIRRNKAATALSVAFISSWPYLLNLLLWPLPWELAYRHSAGNLFAVGAVVICVTTLSVVWLSYETAWKIGKAMSELVAAPGERARLREWLLIGPSLWRQLSVALPMAGVGVALAVVALGDEGGSWPSKGLLFLMGGWLGFLTGNMLYWLLAVALIPGRLMRAGKLRMAWIDPASTPAVGDLSRFYAFIAGGLAVTVLVSEVVAVVYATWQQSEAARDLVVALPVISVAIALYVGVWPFVVISRMVRRQIDLTLDPVRAHLRQPPAALLTSPGFEELVKVYQYFMGLRTLPFRTSALLQYVAGIAASLVVFFVQRYLAME
ncbi:hypothetical protein GCM10009850_040630 [Nonomuraea monospora]|uniref:Uncharacterized protein n=1 Tax=Nonomuraea monospora TaxID=568818 RepID=A0ABN3CHC0_9ACTN